MLVYSLSWCSECVIYNSMNARGRKQTMSILFTLVWRWQLLLCFCAVLLNLCLFIYHCSQKECWPSFLSSLRVLACTDIIHLQPVTQQAGCEFGGNSMHVQIAFQNALGWLRWNSEHISSFTVSLLFWRTCPFTDFTFLSVLLFDECPEDCFCT